MSLESVRAFFAAQAPDIAVIETGVSTATVAEAARAFVVAEGQIAKTLALRIAGRVLLIVAAGDARLDNARMKAAFGGRGRMLGGEEVLALTGHPVGGVCPFGLATPLPVYCDASLRGFAEVLPAGGSLASAVRITPDRLARLTGAIWVDVCNPRANNPRAD
jgi:prolyl-tRNA editing enzyme YbaK/EbsC (Cys-tRNA(Pro) deacylase)